MALDLPKLIFSCLHLPFLSLGLWEAELLHLSQRACLRALKGCYQVITTASTILQAHRVFSQKWWLAQPLCAGTLCHSSAQLTWGPGEDPKWG